MPEINLTNITGADTWAELAVGTSQNLTDGWMGVLFLGGFFIILLISFKGFEGDKAFAVASWITATMATLMYLIFWISFIPLVITYIMAAMGVAILVWRG